MPARKILVVDDSPTVVALLTKQLSASGYEVCTAQDGAEALAMAQSQKPDLIVMDVMMPKMTGYEALQKIREIEALRKIPVLAMSAKASMREFFTDLNSVEFMPKPYEIKALLSKIERLLWKSAEQNPDGSKRVVILGVQEDLLSKIQTAIQERGFQAFVALNEDDAFHLTKQLNAAHVFCQFWEDESLVDARKLKEKLEGHPLLSEVSFFVYCEERLSGEALKTFSGERIILHRNENDLLEKIDDLLKGMM